MSERVRKLDVRQLILVPAVITLGVTLLRLVGELQHWSPRFFSREAGGAGALVGIVWLVPIFGIYFARQLNKAGHGPLSRGRAIGFAVAAILVVAALAFTVFKLALPIVTTVVVTNLLSFIALWIAYRGWPELGRVEVAYGLAARIPVALVMLIAMAANWGTHYELGPPGFPEMSLVPKWVVIGLMPQLTLWIAFTVMVGTLFGSLALLFQKQQPLTEATPSRPAVKSAGAHR